MIARLILTVLLFLGGCASLPVGYERTESHAWRDTSETTLARASQGALQAHAGQSAFRPIPDGIDALLARIQLAEAAERSLDLMYYMWRDDLAGKLLASAVLHAADRGVRVRLLLDDVGSKVNDGNLAALDGHPNIEIRLFNPVASRSNRLLSQLVDFNRINRRMHTKAFVADNQRAMLGGRNIADEYFEANGDGNFADMDVMLAGPAVAAVSDAFDLYWNAPVVYPIRALTASPPDPARLDALRAQLAAFVESQSHNPYVEAAKARAAILLDANAIGIYWGKTHLLFDDPMKVTRGRDDDLGWLMPQFARLGLPLQSELTLVSPYLIPGDGGVQRLAGLVKRGLHVTILTNSLATNDVTPVVASYKRYREPLLEGGIRLYELKPDTSDTTSELGNAPHPRRFRSSLHAKIFFFDRKATFIGSLNLDPRSIELNTEIGIVCENAEMTETLLRRLDAQLPQIAWRLERDVDEAGKTKIVWLDASEKGDVRKLTDEPGASAWKKLQVWFFSLLPIESQS